MEMIDGWASQKKVDILYFVKDNFYLLTLTEQNDVNVINNIIDGDPTIVGTATNTDEIFSLCGKYCESQLDKLVNISVLDPFFGRDDVQKSKRVKSFIRDYQINIILE